MNEHQDNRSTIEICGKNYHIKCSGEHEVELLEAAACLNEEIQNVRHAGKVMGPERIIAMAGLNLAHKYLTYLMGKRLEDPQVTEPAELNPVEERLHSMRHQIHEALEEEKESEPVSV